MRKVYIVSAKRTAIGTFGGTLKSVSAVDLGLIVAKELLTKSDIDVKDIDEVIFGNVLSAGLGQNVARQIAIKAGIGFEIPSFTVNKVCASGMKAVQLAYQAIAIGEADVILAGGTENMNQAPYLVRGARFGLRMNDSTIVDSMVKDGLSCAINDYHMGITAENIAKKYGISRQQQDEFAARSQQKAAKAIASGEFAEEIVPVTVKKRNQTIEFRTDEHPRAGTTTEVLSKLRPAFQKDGTVTAGNASGINDAAAALILASDKFIKDNNIKPMAECIDFTSVGVDPAIMGISPSVAVSKILKKTGIKLDDIEIFELNEAFAAQSIAVLKETGIDPEKINVNGGAVALGHPIGASGARLLVTLLHAMKKRNLKTGLASLCIGGGMGMASIVKRN
ncbi:MAG: acetyl-CoA C-acetyltransferase [Sedimentisphaerales bacterium]|nr:acetyl-CoA C-acetyltransferase [Sedimentisphaerales bacterium]